MTSEIERTDDWQFILKKIIITYILPINTWIIITIIGQRLIIFFLMEKKINIKLNTVKQYDDGGGGQNHPFFQKYQTADIFSGRDYWSNQDGYYNFY